MWLVSDRWDAACRQSRVAVVSAQVWSQGVYTGTDLRVVGGGIRVDEGSRVRRAGTLSSSDIDLMPTDADALLSPASADLLLQVGHVYAEGDTETVPTGMLRVLSVGMPSLDGPLTLELGDYFAVLGGSRFAVPWVTPAGVRVITEVTSIVQSVLPWVEVIDLTGSPAVTRSQVWTGTAGDAVSSLVTAIGAEAFFDPLGRLVIRAVPDGTSPSVWTLDTDTDTAVVEDAEQRLDLSRVYNAVYVESSDPTLTAPVSAVVYQSEGPLRWRPGFRQARRFASPILTTVAACEAAARTLLAKSLIYATDVEPVALPNWALDAGDTVTLAIDSAPTGTRVVSGLTIGLGPTEMSMRVSTRPPLSGTATVGDLTELT